MKEFSEQKRFSVVSRTNSLKHALRGIYLFFKTQHNAWVQLVVAIAVVGAGCYFSITKTEWVLVIFSITSVLVAEAFNTAIEIHMDLTSPGPHHQARDTKDVAAGAVFLAAAGAALVGVIVFGPYLFDFFF